MQLGPGLTRRHWLRNALACPGGLSLSGGLGPVGLAGWLGCGAGTAHAGTQLEEPLIDSVRSALSAAVRNAAPPVPEFTHVMAQMRYDTWFATMRGRLKGRRPEVDDWQDFLQTVWYEAKRAGLDVSLVLGLIQVESNFRKHAVSRVGARGYMQVMPFWTRVIGSGDDSVLFRLQPNLRFGCVILRHYLDREQGDVFMALGRYNGSRGQRPYPDAVLAAQRNWHHAA